MTYERSPNRPLPSFSTQQTARLLGVMKLELALNIHSRNDPQHQAKLEKWMIPMADNDREIERKHIQEFQKFLIDKGAKMEANGEFDVETFIASVKMYKRLSE